MTHLTMGDRRYAQMLTGPPAKRGKALNGDGQPSDPMARYVLRIARGGGFVDPLDWHLTFDDDYTFNWFVQQQ